MVERTYAIMTEDNPYTTLSWSVRWMDPWFRLNGEGIFRRHGCWEGIVALLRAGGRFKTDFDEGYPPQRIMNLFGKEDRLWLTYYEAGDSIALWVEGWPPGDGSGKIEVIPLEGGDA